MANKYGFLSIFYDVLIDEEKLITLLRSNVNLEENLKSGLVNLLKEYDSYSADFEECIRSTIAEIARTFKIKNIRSRSDKIYLLSDKTIIDGSEAGSAIRIIASNVVVKEFTIQNSGNSYEDAGILLDSDNNRIVDNIIKEISLTR